ncbi:MAG: acyltransferase family protein, partial [Clostridium sp.]|uniref:acyltransferase family protein n=1 Tax=Clostridium sp. TaxID=1506 RepID=UPI0029074A92
MLIYSISLIIMSVLLFGIFDYGKEEYEALSVYNTNLLKGIAAILIVISHIGNKYGIRYFTPLGGIGVSVFLMLSGYGLLLSYKKKGLNNFLARRFSGILIPYWIVVIIYSFINIDIFNIYDFIMQILLIKTIPYTWFVQYIIILYIA